MKAATGRLEDKAKDVPQKAGPASSQQEVQKEKSEQGDEMAQNNPEKLPQRQHVSLQSTCQVQCRGKSARCKANLHISVL